VSPDPTRAAWAASLKASPVLCHLPDAELLRLIDDGRLQRFPAGAELIRIDTHTSAVYLIVDGECDVHRADGTLRLNAPALVGEIAALTGTPRTATVRAAGPVQALVIERDRFLDAIRTSAAAGQALTELVADRLCAPDSIRQVDRFPVEGIIGKGASGRVLRARHPLLEIPLALKMLSHALALLPDGPRSFIREASLLVHLDHPGIVRVLDAFEAHRTFFIVMPWIEGATIRERIDGAAGFTPGEVVRIGAEALEALAALHAAGLVHRDIKPSNLFIRSSGQLLLIDFGIACESADRRGDGDTPEHRGFIGSPFYSSPEQILGRPVDGRSDVYSLACTLYELVFGRPPFPGDNLHEVVDGHLHGTPAFNAAARVTMDDPFLLWLQRCLSRTRGQRPDAAAALATLPRQLPAS
jgi:protein kinase-like protein/cyclic nucleotide-binding protein